MKNWAASAAAIVAVEYLVALAIGASAGFRYSIPFAAYAISALTIVCGVATLAIVARLLVYARQREPHPTRRLIAEAPRFAPFSAGVILVALQIGVLTWTKTMLPIASSFWADPLLASMDHAIFHAEPWRVAQSLFGWAEPLIDKVYISWVPVKLVTLILLVALPESRAKTQALLSYFILMAMVAIGQYLLPSAGPIFYAQIGFGGRFAALPTEPWVATVKSYLWQDYLRGGGKLGTGISAMPSLHVAIALWVALVLRAYLPSFSIIGFAYCVIILIGSVLLGWHYVVDGIAAIGITLVAWQAAIVPERLWAAFCQHRELRSAWSTVGR